jgi:hypothetical protein
VQFVNKTKKNINGYTSTHGTISYKILYKVLSKQIVTNNGSIGKIIIIHTKLLHVLNLCNFLDINHS